MTPDDDPQPQFPLYVRVLAVAHVLSLAIGPVGFIILAGISCFLYVRHGKVDDNVLALLATGIACPAACALYRRWFVSWGRMNWPDGKYRKVPCPKKEAGSFVSGSAPIQSRGLSPR